jgi:hypothetical protein
MAVRREVLKRDGYRCVLCGYSNVEALVLDHVEFRIRGGSDDASNLRVLCRYCNARRNAIYASDANLLFPFDGFVGFFTQGVWLPHHRTLVVPSLAGLTYRWEKWRWQQRRSGLTDDEFRGEFRQALEDWNARRPDLRLPVDSEAECGKPCCIIMSRVVSRVMSDSLISGYGDVVYGVVRAAPCYDRSPRRRPPVSPSPLPSPDCNGEDDLSNSN